MTAPRTAGTQLRAGGEEKHPPPSLKEAARLAQATFGWKVHLQSSQSFGEDIQFLGLFCLRASGEMYHKV